MSASNRNAAMLHHLIELRSRLISALIVLFLVFAVLMYFANSLYTLLALPLLKFLPQGHLIATDIVSPFFVPFKLAFMVAMGITMPYFLYQLWRFIAPGLYSNERKKMWLFLLVSSILFYAGILFAYFIIFPMLFRFLSHAAPVGVTFSPDITAYFNFTLKLLVIFGCLFEIPMIMALLTMLQIVHYATWIKWRSYAIVGAFIIGMLLAPPDVLSQTILAIPIWILYEAGIMMIKLTGLSRHEKIT